MNGFNLEDIVRGALIHDIGKIIQRSEENPFQKTHGQWGYEWLSSIDTIKNDPAINACITHHKGDSGVFETNAGLIWYESDNLASSERKQEDVQEKGKWEMFTPLASPFYLIKNPNTPSQVLSDIPYFPLKIMDKLPVCTFKKPEPDKMIKAYKSITEELKKDLSQLGNNYSINSLLMVFEKHLSGVPSTTLEIFREETKVTQKHPDISLFNHSQLTAAIAGCLYRYCSEECADKWNRNDLLIKELLETSPNPQPFLLIGGDISGVQKFIYTITSKGALKSLKGRSFYIELLLEHAVSELLEALKLTRCNIIFSGGGHFYILSHNTKNAKESIDEVKKRIDDYLFNEFKGSLQLNITHVSFGKEGFRNAVPLWEELTDKLTRLKKAAWKNRLYDLLEVEDQHTDCLTESCEICFREDLPLRDLSRGDVIIRVCNPCYDQYQLGNALAGISRSGYPVIYKISEKSKEDFSNNGEFIKIGDYYYKIEERENPNLQKIALAVYRVNDLNAEHYYNPNSTYLPLGIYHFEDMTELSDAVTIYGINRIAVLRMDVDNLGKIFSIAAPDDKAFSRMASISKGLNQFFKYYLNTIVEGRFIEPCDMAGRDIKSKGRMLSIVYSGGDDLFIIGHWLDVLECAYDIKRHFEKYTGNKFITLSGGIAINHEHHPVYQFAREAAELEEIAKTDNKNALALFTSKRFGWELFEKIIERVKFFKNFLEPKQDHLEVKGDKLPKTFFYRLLALARRFNNEEGELVLPKAAYLISKARFKDCIPEDIQKIKEVIMNNNKKQWLITETAVLITLMLMRKGGREDG